MGIEAGDPEIDVVGVIKHPDFGALGGGDAILGFALAESGDWSGLLPGRVREGAVDTGGVVNADGMEQGEGWAAASVGKRRRRYLNLNTRNLKGIVILV